MASRGASRSEIKDEIQHFQAAWKFKDIYGLVFQVLGYTKSQMLNQNFSKKLE